MGKAPKWGANTYHKRDAIKKGLDVMLKNVVKGSLEEKKREDKDEI